MCLQIFSKSLSENLNSRLFSVSKPFQSLLFRIPFFFREPTPLQTINNIENYWASLAVADLEACRNLIKNQHPFFIDRKSSHKELHSWFSEGYNQALKLARNASSFEGYKAALMLYIAGFRDGHLYLRILPPDSCKITWPGFLLSYRSGKFRVASTLFQRIFYGAPPNGAEVIAINKKSPELLMQESIFRFNPADPAIPSSWRRLAPFLLLDNGNPWAEKISSITYKTLQKTQDLPLRYFTMDIKKDFIHVAHAGYGPRPSFSLREFGKNGVWISIPSFATQSQETQKNLQNIVDQLSLYKSKTNIVFDLRGNTGGDSAWVMKILASLYGIDYLGSLPYIKNAKAYIEDRVTPAVLDHLKQGINGDFEAKKYYEKAKIAYDQGKSFVQDLTDIHRFFSKIKKKVNKAPIPVSGRVYLLTDGHCFSSGLIFSDTLLSIPGVIHVGDTTNGDTQFTQPIELPLPSNLGKLIVPVRIRRNWERGDNEPYIPTHIFPGHMENTQELERWIESL